MNGSNLYQYISSIIEKRFLYRIIQLSSKSANVILDLEDSIQDVDNLVNTSLLKEKARDNLRQLSNVFTDIEIGIRINQINSIDYNNDIVLLSDLENVKWRYIILPKIESQKEVQQFLNETSHINYQEIILCIETVNGLRNIKSMLEEINSEKIRKIQFGHFDYFLDKGAFPIPDQTNPLFWETCELLIEQIEKSGFTYLHSPINALNEQSLTHSIVKKLKKTCKNEFGFATLSLTQNKLLTNYNELSAIPLVIKSNDSINKISYANEIINYFSTNKSKFSFRHKNQERVFIPPQEYYAAKLFLSNYE